MLGIKAIASYLPDQRRSNADLATRFEMSETFLREKIGVVERAIKEPGQTASDLALLALQKLMTDTGLDPRAVQALVVVTQNPDRRIPHVAALVHGRAGLADSCAAFDVSLGCSGYVYGLSILKSFMEANGMTTGVLITADPYSVIIDEADRNTSLLFGDAATATLLSDDPVWTLEAFTFGSRGGDWSAIRTEQDRLVMEGRRVFSFAATAVPADIRRLLERTGVTADEVKLFVMHQGSRYIVKTIADRLEQSADKFPIEIEHCGNTVSSSIPLVIEGRLRDPALDRVVLSGFGVGLSWASCLCTRAESRHAE